MQSKKRILIVDDTPPNIQLLGNILQENYAISFAQSGMEALKRLEKNEFDLILLDIMMPEMDGFEVCKRLRNNEKTKEIPIIFLSAKNDRESVMHGLEIGAQDYVTKPFEGRELLTRVKTQIELIENRKKIDELKEAAHCTDEEVSNLLFENMKEFYQKLMFLTLHQFVAQKLQLVKTDEISSQNDPTQALSSVETSIQKMTDFLKKHHAEIEKLAGKSDTEDLISDLLSAPLKKDLLVIREVVKHTNTMSNSLFFFRENVEFLREELLQDYNDIFPVQTVFDQVIFQLQTILPESIILEAPNNCSDQQKIVGDDLFLLVSHGIQIAAESILLSDDTGNITCTISNEDEKIIIEITDSGSGLPTAKRVQLLNNFLENLDETDSRILGLYICNWLISSKYNGKIEFTEKNAKTCMIFHIYL